MPDLLTEPVHDGDHVRESPGADLELVMYGDFECPYCAAAQGIVARVNDRLGERLRFVFRHFPIPEVHPHAWPAARASEAAAEQGAFWQMHDALYAARGRLSDDDLIGHAAELGLEAERVGAALSSGEHDGRIAQDLESGEDSGVQGTPAFFANGRRVEGSFDAGSLVEALLAE